MHISVVTPAHNEEDFLGKCVDSVAAAAANVAGEVEHIVVLNRCTDGTEAIARAAGCKVVVEDARYISRIRNAGAAAAEGRIIVTVDADSWMSPNMLTEVCRMLETGRFVGGGVRMFPERWSAGLIATTALIAPFILWNRILSAGMFWCYREDFDAVGGFDEQLISIEDIDFAQRLKRRGRESSRRYGTIRRAHLTTSCRKFDEFGDWYFVKDPRRLVRLLGRDKAMADAFYYDVRSAPGAARSHGVGSIDSDQ
ncbi:MAG: glycosyltransferase [Gammaproteobacteria bacterium]|nr:glycosyltransferase [Gammaproteobacteria bacterium]